MQRETTARREYFKLALLALPGIAFWAAWFGASYITSIPALVLVLLWFLWPIVCCVAGVLTVTLRRTPLYMRAAVLAIDASLPIYLGGIWLRWW